MEVDTDFGCFGCRSFVLDTNHKTTDTAARGECRRYPPTPAPSLLLSRRIYPIVGAGDWCDEFVIRLRPLIPE